MESVTGKLTVRSVSLERAFTMLKRQQGQLRARIEKGWMGRAPSTKKAYNAPGDHVHRIKVDEQRGFIITTYSEGGLTGLTVTDIATDTALWTFDTVKFYDGCLLLLISVSYVI